MHDLARHLRITHDLGRTVSTASRPHPVPGAPSITGTRATTFERFRVNR